MSFLENFLFCKRIDGRTTSVLVFSVINHFLEWDGINRKSCIGPCTDEPEGTPFGSLETAALAKKLTFHFFIINLQ
jgi:hypothetical protein